MMVKFLNTKCSDMTIGQSIGYVTTMSLLSIGVAVATTAAVEWISNIDFTKKEKDAEEEEWIRKPKNG